MSRSSLDTFIASQPHRISIAVMSRLPHWIRRNPSLGLLVEDTPKCGGFVALTPSIYHMSSCPSRCSATWTVLLVSCACLWEKKPSTRPANPNRRGANLHPKHHPSPIGLDCTLGCEPRASVLPVSLGVKWVHVNGDRCEPALGLRHPNLTDRRAFPLSHGTIPHRSA